MAHNYHIGTILYHKQDHEPCYRIVSKRNGQYDIDPIHEGDGRSSHRGVAKDTLDDLFYTKSVPVVQLEDSLFTV